MIGRSANETTTGQQDYSELTCNVVLDILKRYEQIIFRQVSETEFLFFPISGKHIQFNKMDMSYLFIIDFNWHPQMKCYVLKT